MYASTEKMRGVFSSVYLGEFHVDLLYRWRTTSCRWNSIRRLWIVLSMVTTQHFIMSQDQSSSYNPCMV